MVDTFGTGKVSNEKLVEIIRENFDLRPAGIIKMLDLRRPIYKQTAAYGHFGRHDVDLPWEKLDRVEDLKKYLQENVLLSVIKQDRNADCVKIKTINNRIKEG